MSVNYFENNTLQQIAGKSVMDAQLSSTSTNGVQNKVIKAAIDNINSNLGNKSSASAVAGNDAFSKINALNQSLSGSAIRIYTAEPTLIGKAVIATFGTERRESTFDGNGYATITGIYGSTTVRISATDGISTATTSVSISGNDFKLYNARLAFPGSGLDLADWLSAGSTTAHPINPSSYPTFADVEADEEVVRQLMTVHNAVDYLATSDGTDELIGQVINSDICAKWINLRDYALDTLSANSDIKALMDTADKYGYGEWALMPQVPKMTSNTAPYGEALESTYTSGQPAYKAFDGDASTGWASGNGDTSWHIGYKFTEAVVVKKIYYMHPFNGGYYTDCKFIVQGSNDDFSTIGYASEEITVTTSQANAGIYISISNNQPYRSYRLLFTVPCYVNGNAKYCYANSLQFYAWQPKGNVPIMTSNTAPYGEAAAWQSYSGTDAYMAFDGNYSTNWAGATAGTSYVAYKFTNPVNVKRLSIKCYYISKIEVLYAESHSSDLISLGEFTLDASGETSATIDLNNSNYGMVYAVKLKTITSNAGAIRELQFYGRELSVSVPTMTSNTAPYGEAISSGEAGPSSAAWMAFDADKTSAKQWAGTTAQSATNIWVGYHFTLPVKVKRITLSLESTRITSCSYKFQGSNDGTTWEDITTTYTDATLTTFDTSNDGTYKYYRLFFASQTTGSSYWGAGRVNDLQFYGLDYSEREFAEGSTMKYIYDHGVKPNGNIDYHSYTGYSAEEVDGRYIQLHGGGNNVVSAYQRLDLTDYDVFRFKAEPSGINSTTYNFIWECQVTNGEPISISESALAYVQIQPSDGSAPNNMSADISAISQEKYISLTTANGRNGAEYYSAYNEWWLE